ncbi:hypothetical protein WDU94_005104 [Cyamophila willieti]
MMQSQTKTKSQDEYCRICGMVLSCNRLHIFQMEPIVRKKIFKLMPYKIFKDDGLPQDCCYKCNDTLKQFISFVDRSWCIQKTFLRTVYKDGTESNKHASIHLSGEWYCDSSEDQNTKKTENQTKLSEDHENESEFHDKQDKGQDNTEESIVGNMSESIQTKDTESMSNFSTQVSEESDTTTNMSSHDLDDKKKHKRKLKQKFKRDNPFCARKPQKRGKKRKTDESENSIATNKGSRSTEQRSRGRLCQLVVDGKVTLVRRPTTLNGPNFILSRIPSFGLIYCCKKCSVIYTTEEAAETHQCNEPCSTPVSDKLGESSYHCEVCDLKFLRRVTLEHHMSTHVDVMESDVSDDDSPTPRAKSRQKARHSSESSVEIRLNSRKRVDSSESERSSGISESDNNSDNFVVPDDYVEYD